jgi:hypothetical protein
MGNYFCKIASQNHDNSIIQQDHVVSMDILEYAETKLCLDESRQKFFLQHWNIITKLVKGELFMQNRFREMLLGSKAVGKSSLFLVLGTFTKLRYP